MLEIISSHLTAHKVIISLNKTFELPFKVLDTFKKHLLFTEAYMVRRKFKNVQKRNREAEKKKRMQVGISIFFVFLMVFSVMGIYVSQQQNSSLDEFNYNEYSFEVIEETPGQYALSTLINGQEKIFYALPQDTLTISTTGNVTEVIGSTGYVALAHNISPELIPLVDLMRFDFDRYAQTLTVDVPLYSNTTPEGVSCLNATPEVPVITLVESDETQIVVEGYCVQIESQPTDLYLIRDRLLYSLLGVIQG